MTGFTFYRNYYELIKYLNNEDRLELFDAIVNYIFEDKEPELDGLKKGIWLNLKMPLDTSKNNSGRGGRKTKKKPKANQKETELKPIENRIKTEKKPIDKQIYISNFLFLFSNLNISNLNNKDNIYKLLQEYLEIRLKNKYIVNETIVNRLINKLNTYGTTDEQKIKIIENAINGSWKDFYELNDKEKNLIQTSDVVPNWVGKEHKAVMATEEEINELDRLMKEAKE